MTTRNTSTSVCHALAKKYPAPEYAFFTEVGNGTSHRKTRAADALAFGLWSTRGHDLHGFEIKVSRSDWLSELRNPKKADDIAKFCSYWWLVIGNGDEAKLEEIPEMWGLMSLEQKGEDKVLKMIKKAPKLEAQPLNIPMIAGILRRCSESMVPYCTISEQLQERYKAGVEAGQVQVQSRVVNIQVQLDRLREQVRVFETVSGVSIASYDGKNIGTLVKQLNDAACGKALIKQIPPLRNLHLTLQNLADQTHKALESSVTVAQELHPELSGDFIRRGIA